MFLQTESVILTGVDISLNLRHLEGRWVKRDTAREGPN